MMSTKPSHEKFVTRWLTHSTSKKPISRPAWSQKKTITATVKIKYYSVLLLFLTWQFVYVADLKSAEHFRR